MSAELIQRLSAAVLRPELTPLSPEALASFEAEFRAVTDAVARAELCAELLVFVETNPQGTHAVEALQQILHLVECALATAELHAPRPERAAESLLGTATRPQPTPAGEGLSLLSLRCSS